MHVTVEVMRQRPLNRLRFQLRAEGHEIRDGEGARLSPLKHKNLNVLGRYNFIAFVPVGGSRRG